MPDPTPQVAFDARRLLLVGVALAAILLAVWLNRDIEVEPDAAPPVVVEPASPEDVKRGEYLARAGDCVSCHTASGGIAYAGGLALDTPFGQLVAPNITPDEATGLGRWSADDFYAALHDGVGRHVGDLYPAMPYVFFTRVTRADSDLIYGYLRSLPPVSNRVVVDRLRFPFSVRATMMAWRELFFRAGEYRPDPGRTVSWNRGAYLVEGLGHCGACHTPRNALGAVEPGKALTGASIDDWFALNLTSALDTGLGDWSVDQVVTYLKTGASKSKSTALGPMREVVHNSLSQLTDDDLRAMAEYLKALPADPSTLGAPPRIDVGERAAAQLYLDHCAACHQAKGRGIPGAFPPLAGNGVVRAPEATDILRVALAGVPARGGYPAMPSFAYLSDSDLAAIANYVRTHWGNDAPPNATGAAVADVRRLLTPAR